MAELILTPEENSSLSLLDWDNESIGKAVKRIAIIFKDERGENSISFISGVALLICKAVDADSDGLTVIVDDLTCKEKNLGSWKVVVTRED